MNPSPRWHSVAGVSVGVFLPTTRSNLMGAEESMGLLGNLILWKVDQIYVGVCQSRDVERDRSAAARRNYPVTCGISSSSEQPDLKRR